MRQTSFHMLSLLASLFISTFLIQGTALATPDITIADFESSDYGNWIVVGGAFGQGPAHGTLPDQMEVSGFRGKGLASSYHGGDEPKGSLTSPEFKIERRHLRFQIGGGGYKGKTCVNLLIDGTVVRSATGTNTRPGGSEELRAHSWNVTEYLGSKARIQITDNHSGDWGHINVDHFVMSDKPIRKLEGISREFLIDQKYLIFPIDNNAPSQRMTLAVRGEKVREFELELASDEPDFWVFLDTHEFQGSKVTLRAEKLQEEQLEGFLDIRQDSTYPGEVELYKEKLRPQLHFTSRRGWNNDSNGMMYYDGEFHLFYQHNPFGWNWGNMTWGHAISEDLVHWRELGDALHPDASGTMFSGSGVVDWNNTTGFQTGDDPALICIYTSAGYTNAWSRGKPFTQGIAYSNDRGRTWTKYKGNPVQGHLNQGNRDPKVIWWEETQEWVIVLYLSDSRMAFFRSPDLKRWELQSVLKSFHECPELFELPLHGNEQASKWILYGASGDYLVGEFDGSHFIPDGEQIQFHYGDCFYASQTFSDIPEADGRRIQIAWGQIDAPGMPFNQMMTFPVVLTLRSTDDGPRMFAYPVEEIQQLYTQQYEWDSIALEPGNVETAPEVEGELFDIDVELEVGSATEIGVLIRGEELLYRADRKQLVFGENEAPLETIDGRIRLRCIVDRTSLEIFANDGSIYMPCRFRPQEENRTLAAFARGGHGEVTLAKVRVLESIWKNQP